MLSKQHGSHSLRSSILSLLVVLLVVGMAITATGCQDKALVGTWMNIEGMTIEFTSDGRMTSAELGEYGTPYETKGDMIVTSEDSLLSYGYEYKINGNTLTLTANWGDNVVFTKLREGERYPGEREYLDWSEHMNEKP
jgi:hypothetical protein